MAELQIIKRRKIWYGISLAALLPAIISLAVFGLKLGIDFTGGSTLEIKGQVSENQIREIAASQQVKELNLTSTAEGGWIINYQVDGQVSATPTGLADELARRGVTVVRSDQIGPSVSQDLLTNALLAVGLMSLAVVAYITWAFRAMPKSVSSFKFGLATLTAAFAHDGLLVVGVFAILGQAAGVQVDSYIVTALLTVIGFSIHDTIVVFDRIREKLSQANNKINFERLVNSSINETMVRSLNTSIVIILVLLALYLFGGQSIRYFTLALLLGMVAGTYSSIFIAAPLLVSWQPKRSK